MVHVFGVHLISDLIKVGLTVKPALTCITAILEEYRLAGFKTNSFYPQTRGYLKQVDLNGLQLHVRQLHSQRFLLKERKIGYLDFSLSELRPVIRCGSAKELEYLIEHGNIRVAFEVGCLHDEFQEDAGR